MINTLNSVSICYDFHGDCELAIAASICQYLRIYKMQFGSWSWSIHEVTHQSCIVVHFHTCCASLCIRCAHEGELEGRTWYQWLLLKYSKTKIHISFTRSRHPSPMSYTPHPPSVHPHPQVPKASPIKSNPTCAHPWHPDIITILRVYMFVYTLQMPTQELYITTTTKWLRNIS